MEEVEFSEMDFEEFDDSATEGYLHSVRLKLFLNFLLLFTALFLAFYSLSFNGSGLDFFQTMDLLIRHFSGEEFEYHSSEWFDFSLLWNYSIPRMIFTILAAAGLAISGVAMQSMMNNPLADPYTIGVSSGACLGLAVATIVGLSINNGMRFAISLMAFLFALIPMVIIVILAPRTRSSPSTLILAGVAISYLFNSVNTILMVTVDSEVLETIYNWQTGTLVSIRWESLPMTLLATTVGSAVILFLSRQLNLLSMGDASATSLGVDPDNLRIICLMVIAFIVGTIVGNAGIIGFVGLVTPHITRIIIGSDNRMVIPFSALLAMVFMFTADIICRCSSVYDNIPIGSVLSLIGAPIFLYLILRRKSNVW